MQETLHREFLEALSILQFSLIQPYIVIKVFWPLTPDVLSIPQLKRGFVLL